LTPLTSYGKAPQIHFSVQDLKELTCPKKNGV
jgi:hypothetical protein